MRTDNLDENLRVAVVIRLPDQPDDPDAEGAPQVIQDIFDKLDVHLDVSATDGSYGSVQSPVFPGLVGGNAPRRSSSIKSTDNLIAPQDADRIVHRRGSSLSKNSLQVPSLMTPQGSVEENFHNGDGEEIKVYEKTVDHRNPLDDDVYQVVGYFEERWCCVFLFNVPLSGAKGQVQNKTLEALVVVSKERDASDIKSPRSGTPTHAQAVHAEASSHTVFLLDRFVDGDEDEDEASDTVSFTSSPSTLTEPSMHLHAPMPVRTFSRKNSRMDSVPSLPIRFIKRRTIPIKSPMTLRVTCNWTSLLENTMLISVELGNDKNADHTYQVERVNFEISNAAVNLLGSPVTPEEPIVLRPSELYSFLYHVKLLDESLGLLNSRPFSTNTPAYASQTPLTPGSGLSSQYSPVAPPAAAFRDVLVQVFGAPQLGPDIHIDAMGHSEWNFPLDVSDQEKRRVQESFRAGAGSRSTVVYPPLEKKEELSSSVPRRPTIVLANEANERRSSSGRSHSGSLLVPRPHSPSGDASERRLSDAPAVTALVRRTSFIAPPLRKKATTVVGGTALNEPSYGVGVVVSFSIDGPVEQGKPFAVEAFLVNRSSKTKTYTIIVPSRQRGTRRSTTKQDRYRSTSNDHSFSNLMKVEPGDMLSKFTEGQKNDASLVCLDTNVKLSPLYPGSCQSIHLHFLPFRDRYNTVELVQLFDNESGAVTSLRDVLEVYVKPMEEN
jgi:hypothetical protein